LPDSGIGLNATTTIRRRFLLVPCSDVIGESIALSKLNCDNCIMTESQQHKLSLSVFSCLDPQSNIVYKKTLQLSCIRKNFTIVLRNKQNAV